MCKTNAIRILESKNINHTTHHYEVNEDDLSGITVANKINADPDAVFKTLVTNGDKTGVTVFCIPVSAELNLKKAASASGNKKIEMIKVKDLFPLTGYVRGGCSPIGMKKNYPTFFEDSAEMFDKIFVSAGVKGIQICLSPLDVVEVVQGKFVDLV
ncbi:MAG: Cys-tRNA(Pro) deacylase [Ignavibacteriaceae bacterium]